MRRRGRGVVGLVGLSSCGTTRTAGKDAFDAAPCRSLLLLRCLLLLLWRQRLLLGILTVGSSRGKVVKRAGSGSELMVEVVLVLSGEGMVVLRRRQDGAVALALGATYVSCSVGEILVVGVILILLLLTCGVIERRATANAILQIRRIGAGAVELGGRGRGPLWACGEGPGG